MADIKVKTKSGSWILWWKIDSDELQKQVDEYNSLKIYQAARGLSLLLFLLSACFSGIMILLNRVPAIAAIDSILFIILGIFMYKGHRWAMIVSMLLWTFEKISLIGGTPGSIIVQIIWWALYMHAFYFAFKVEQKKRALPPADVETQVEIEVKGQGDGVR